MTPPASPTIPLTNKTPQRLAFSLGKVTKNFSCTPMMTLAVNDRISYKGEKATVKQVWKKKVKLILSDLREMTVGIEDVEPADEVAPGQLPLTDLSTYQLPARTISQWDLENEDSIETLTVDSDQSEDALDLTVDSDQSVDALEIDVRSLPTYQLITLYEVITRELINRGECLPNLDPNLDPNSHPIDGYEEIKTIKGRQYRYWRWYENDKKRSRYLGPCENDKKSC